MTPEAIAEKARNSLSKFCIEECRSYCCRKGSLILKKEEVEVVCGESAADLIKNDYLYEIGNGKLRMSLSNDKGSCPSFKEGKCSIHKNPLRPKVCKDFPLFLKEDGFLLSYNCHAVRENMLYPYAKKLVAMGLKELKE